MMLFSRLALGSRSASLVSAAVGVSSRIRAPAPVLSLLQTHNNNKNNNTNHQHHQQQLRFRWTKAKKKRTARFQRRQEFAKEGKSLPKPPYYFPKDTPVVNAGSNRDERLTEIQQHDEKVSAELHAKLLAAQAKPLLRHHMAGALNMSDRVRKLFDLHNGNQREVIKAQKQRGMEVFQLREGDTGSSAVQVIALTTRIQQLQTHMASHKKDKHSKKGMDALYIRRRKTLDYLERKNFESYRRVVKTLGLVR